MKRLISAIVLFALAIGMGVFGHITLMKTCDELIGELNACIEIANSEDTEKLIEKSEYMNKWWDKKHTVLSVLVLHHELDTIQSFLPSLKELARFGDIEEYIENCLECINMTKDMKMNEEIDIGNVF